MTRKLLVALAVCSIPMAAHAAGAGLNLALPLDTKCSVVDRAEAAGDKKLSRYREFVRQIYLISNSKTIFDPSDRMVVQTLAGVVLAYCWVFPHENIHTLIVANEALVKIQVMEYSAGL